MNASGGPEYQEEVHQQEHPCGGEWNWAEDCQDFQSYTEPYPTFIQTPSWPTEYPNYQPCHESQNSEFYPLTFEPDHPSHYLFCPNHPYQTCLPETGNRCQTWSMGGWQPLNTPYYPDQTCPNQPQHQPHRQQSFEPTPDENHHINSAEKKVEGATSLPQKVLGCTRSEAEIIAEMHHTYEEQESEMDHMIKQVVLLSVMIKEIQENRANHGEKSDHEEDGMIVTTEGESEVMFQEDQGAEEPSVEKEGGSITAGKPFHKINGFIGYHVDEGGPNLKEDKSRKRAAKAIYWEQLQHWPKTLKKKEPPCTGIRPREKRKIKGTYKNHKKKRGVMGYNP